jgi:hypothetical protein
MEVADGSCGFLTRIVVNMEDDTQVGITLSSECQAVEKWGWEIGRVDWRECLGQHPMESHLWRSAMEKLRHRSCPVFTGVVRAIETEVAAAKPAGIVIRFISGDTSDQKTKYLSDDNGSPINDG